MLHRTVPALASCLSRSGTPVPPSPADLVCLPGVLGMQVAGAALLESLLATVPDSDFLLPGRARDNKVGAGCRSPPGLA